jgi:hypothetical protein
MFTSSIIVILLLFFVFYGIYKRERLQRLFSLNISTSTNEFQVQLEQTAEAVIKRLETQIAHLEYMLAEADTKIVALDKQIQDANTIMNQYSSMVTAELPHLPLVHTEPEIAVNSLNTNGNLMVPALQEEQLEFFNQDLPTKEVVTKEVLNNDKHRVILDMAEQGNNITEIARATGIGKGEIMLLLQLNKK